MKLGQMLLIGFVFAIVMAAAAPAGAVDPDPKVKKIFDKMVAAIQTNDRDAFVANGTDTVKDGVTKEVMDAVHKLHGARLKKGFEAAYLCQLKQEGVQHHLWKVTFKDGGDDLVIRVGLKDGKVATFLFQ